MQLSLYGLVRPIAFVSIVLTMIAAILGRMVPDEPEFRQLAPVRYHSLNAHLFKEGSEFPRFLDVETGEIVRIALQESGRLEHLSESPWRNARGQAQTVGLWQELTEGRRGRVPGDFGLARYTFPEGRVLDRLPLEAIFPTSVPCWYPGSSLRVLFAAADGRLYRVSFAEENGYVRTDTDDLLHPRPLEWRTPLPSFGASTVNDPSWPTDPRFEGKIFATITFATKKGSQAIVNGSRLWWLQLNHDATVVEKAGRLTLPGDDGAERWPSLVTMADGTLLLAYLARNTREPGWRLRLVPLSIDPVTGVPQAGRPIVVRQSGEGLPAPPAFSSDGRWVHIVSRRDGSPSRVERFSVSVALQEANEPRLAQTGNGWTEFGRSAGRPR